MNGKYNLLDKKVGQIGFVVKDVDALVKNYYDRFGIGDWKIYTYGPDLLSYMKVRGKDSQYSSRIALSYLGETRIELIQPLYGDTIFQDFINSHGYGVQHLGIYVPNIAEAIKEAESFGFSVIFAGGGFGPDGDGHYAYLNTEEQFGVTYELIERPKRRHEPEAVYPAV